MCWISLLILVGVPTSKSKIIMIAANNSWLHLDILFTDIFLSFLYLFSVFVSNCKLAYSSVSSQLPLLFELSMDALSDLSITNIRLYVVDEFNQIVQVSSSLADCISIFDFSACAAHKQYLQSVLPYASCFSLFVAAIVLVVQSNKVNRAVLNAGAHSSPYEQSAGKELKVGSVSELDSGNRRAAVAVTPKDKLSRAIHMQAAFNTISKQKNLLMTPKSQLKSHRSPSPTTSGLVPGSAISGITVTPRLRSPEFGGSLPQSQQNRHASPMRSADTHLRDVSTPASHYQYPPRTTNGNFHGDYSPMSTSSTHPESVGGPHDDTYSIVSNTDQHVAFDTKRFVGPDGTQASTSMSILSKAHVPVGLSVNSRDSPEYVLRQSVEFPSVLVGWRVHVPMEQYGDGIVLAVQRKKFRPTHFQIQFDRDPTKMVALPLQRSLKKGTIPFSLISKI